MKQNSRILYGCLLAIFFVGMAPMLWGQGRYYQNRPPKSEMEKGIEAYNKGDFLNALQYFNRIIQKNSEDPYVYVYRGNTYFALENYKGALADYSQALAAYEDPRKRGSAALERESFVVYGVAQLSTQQAAMLYSNRATAKYFLGDRRGAIQDYRDALRLDPQLTSVRRQLDMAVKNQPVPRPKTNPYAQPEEESMAYAALCSRPSNLRYNRYNLYQDRDEDQVEEIRYQRALHQKLVDPKFKDRFQKPFNGHKITSRGLLIPGPPVGGQSQTYVEISSVKLTTKGTFVTLKVLNETSSELNLCIDNQRGSGAFYLTDRSGRTNSRIPYKRVTGIEVYPGTTKLKGGESLTVVLEFRRIPNNWGFINLIEGARGDGQGWNFYDIDLTK